MCLRSNRDAQGAGGVDDQDVKLPALGGLLHRREPWALVLTELARQGRVLLDLRDRVAEAVGLLPAEALLTPALVLSHDDEPWRHPGINDVSSGMEEAVAPPTTGTPAYVELTPMSGPPRMLQTINRAAVLAMMNQGSELPAGFRFGLNLPGE